MLVIALLKHTKKKWIKNNMSKYNHHSLALTEEEQIKLDAVKKSTGLGVKKIFMAMIEALLPKNTMHEDKIENNEEE